jgi:hypothetical protein
VATEGSGVGTVGMTMMVIWDGRREAIGVGRRNDRASTFSSEIKDSVAAADDNRGASAPPNLSSDTRAFEHHRHANARAFVLGQGRKDDCADCVVVGNSGARGDVHRGRRGTDKAEGDADNTIC